MEKSLAQTIPFKSVTDKQQKVELFSPLPSTEHHHIRRGDRGAVPFLYL